MSHVTTVLAVAVLLLSTAALAAQPVAEPASAQTFHPERYGKEIGFDQADRHTIHWTFSFRNFLAEQTEQLRLEIDKFKPVKFVREAPLSTVARGPIQLEPEHYPSVQFSMARW